MVRTVSQLTTSAPPPTSRDDRTNAPSRWVRRGEWIAFAALVAAFIGALGPATPISTTYSWPPPTLPAATPTTSWYSPLLLASRVPQRLEARIPCDLPRPLTEPNPPTRVLATARSPVRSDGLVVSEERGVLTLQIGGSMLLRRPLAITSQIGADCLHRLIIDDGKWSLDSGTEHAGGDLERMPVVNGLFSELDLGDSRSRPMISVTTHVHRVSPTNRQTVAWILAVALALASLGLVVVSASRPGVPSPRRVVRRAIEALHPVDGLVALALVTWWIVGPTFYDDGWTIARQTAFESAGGFSQYYESFGVNLPIGFWLEWTQQWLTRSTDAMVVLRLPALLCLLATWLLCRWTFAQARCGIGASAAGMYALGVTFVSMAMAWGMTLRQEPAVALLTAGTLACFMKFIETRSTTPLAVVAILTPLAITAHPAGVVALAPALAIAPSLWRWMRANAAVGVAIFVASGALLLTLAFVGSDVVQRGLDAQTLSTYSSTVVDWRNELSRYERLTAGDAAGVGWGPPMRRGAVALMLLATIAFLFRFDRSARPRLDLASRSLVIALLLLVLTPSKWPWHFGALTALVAVAAASESARWRNGSQRLTRSLVGVGVIVVAALWSWSPRGAWNAIDLRTLDWTLPFETVVPVPALAVTLPLVVLLFALATGRRRGRSGTDVSSSIASWGAPLLAVPLIVFTIGLLVVDAAVTESWSLPRANLTALTGSRDCGLADELVVPALQTAQPLEKSRSLAIAPPSAPGWIPRAPMQALERFALGPTSSRTSSTPWFDLPSKGTLALFVAGRPSTSDRLAVVWGAKRAGRLDDLGFEPLTVRLASEDRAVVPWRLVAVGDVAIAPSAARAVRFERVNDAPPGSALAATGPFSYGTMALTSRMMGGRALTLPQVLPFFPCTKLPQLNNGVAQSPRWIVSTDDRAALRDVGTSPFTGILDLYELEPLRLSGPNAPPSLVAFEVNQRIDGAALAVPKQATAVDQ